jgi:two-component sensor histidine kinase
MLMQTYLRTMQRLSRTGLITALLIVTVLINVCAQTGKVVYEGDVNKQRLLLHATSQYLYNISQGQIDEDSALLISCEIYGLNRFLTHNEGYSDGQTSAAATLLQAGRVKEVQASLSTTTNESRKRLLIELASYFIFKSGKAQSDLNMASDYIDQAIQLSESEKSIPWKIEALRLRAFLLHQYGRIQESQATSTEVINLAEQFGNKHYLAYATLDAARLLPYGHPSRLSYFENVLSLFQGLQANEKVIETLSDMNVEYFTTRQLSKVDEYLNKILQAHQKIGYRHNQYVYDVMAYLADIRSEYATALAYSNKSMACVLTKNDSVLAPFFYSRKAAIFSHLRKYEEAFVWFDKALVGKTKETRLFWYKAFLGKALTYNFLNKSNEALALIEETGRDFPPVSFFEEMYFTWSKGLAYHRLKEFELADDNYNLFLSMADRFPPEYIHSEFPQALGIISRFYCETNRTKKARELLEKTRPFAFRDHIGKSQYYQNLFKIDSIEKKYIDALQNYRLLWIYADSANSVEQRMQSDELLVKYETEKKDKDIQLLTQQSQLQDARLQQSTFVRNITFGGAGLAIIIAGLLYYLFRLKQKSNNQLKHLLDEKEWLLKEVHHRVKNNLQTVLSLLESQSRQLSNEAFHAIQESQNRVYAMSLIHKKLYQSTDVSSINMEDYLRDLLQHLRDSFGSSGSIRFSLQLDPVELDVSQAVPIGLIVNEAITNSIKYAFPMNRDGNEINIALKKVTDNKIVLLITDNGVGITDSTENTQSLGLKLMRGLTEDIDGTFSVQSQHGVTIAVEFVANIPFERITETVELQNSTIPS